MKNNNFFFLFMLFVMMSVIACSKKISPYEDLTASKEGAMVFIAKSHMGIENLSIFPFTDEDRVTKFNVGFGAIGLPANDISITLREDDHVFDSLNNARIVDGLEPYERFPVDAYDIDQMNLTIPKGGLDSDFSTLTYKSKQFDATKQYLLALTIDDASGYEISSMAKTLLFVAKVEEGPASTFGWIAQASSEEPAENTGLASAILDGNLNTIWHSAYKSGTVPFPFWLTIDMIEPVYVTKIAMVTRQNSVRGFTKFNLEGSLDGENWFSLGDNLTFDPENFASQFYPIESQYLKNIRLTITAGVRAPTFLAEFIVYSY